MKLKIISIEDLEAAIKREQIGDTLMGRRCLTFEFFNKNADGSFTEGVDMEEKLTSENQFFYSSEDSLGEYQRSEFNTIEIHNDPDAVGFTAAADSLDNLRSNFDNIISEAKYLMEELSDANLALILCHDPPGPDVKITPICVVIDRVPELNTKKTKVII